MAEYGFQPEDKSFATRAIDTCFSRKRWDSSSVVPNTVLDINHTPAVYKLSAYTCSRDGYSTFKVLQETVASLENARYGLSFSSGLGTVTAVSRLLKIGDHCLCIGDPYGDIYNIFDALLSASGIEHDIIDNNPSNDKVIHERIKNNTKMLWMETPTNPLVTYFDIAEACKVAHELNLIVVVDNTFLTPYFQKPLELGADIVTHSLTKYCHDHLGAIIGAAVTNDEETYKKLKYFQNAFDVIPSPLDCYLVIRSLKTLKIRVAERMRSSLKIAKFLDSHPLVESVFHPALESHPGHKIAKKQTSGWNGMLAFYIEGGLEESKTLLSNLKLFTVAQSAEDYGSFVEIPSVTTYASLPLEEKLRLGVTDNLLRMSVGLENVDDLIDDLRRALDLFTDVTKL